jgi:hypothetical protein
MMTILKEPSSPTLAKKSSRSQPNTLVQKITWACFDILNAHVSNAYKIAPAGSPHTVGWNLTMLPNEIFDQLMLTYGKPTPDAVHQNNVMFFSAYNPQDPPELLFKRITDCREVGIVAKVCS